MTLLQRIGYYLGGFSLGLIILAFFFKEKKTEFSYLPDARVHKNINSKKIVYGSLIVEAISNRKIDSTSVMDIIKNGDINLSESQPRQKPCGIYLLEGNFKNNKIFLSIENCDSIATVVDLKIK